MFSNGRDDGNDNTKAIALPWVLSKNSQAKNKNFTKNFKSKKGHNSCKMNLELSPLFVDILLFTVNIIIVLYFEFQIYIYICSVMAET